MNKLPKDVEERIAKESLEEAKKRNMSTASYRYGYEDGYYHGGTAEATRALEREKILVDALEKIINSPQPYNESEMWSWIHTARNISNEALANYAKGGDDFKEWLEKNCKP